MAELDAVDDDLPTDPCQPCKFHQRDGLTAEIPDNATKMAARRLRWNSDQKAETEGNTARGKDEASKISPTENKPAPRVHHLQDTLFRFRSRKRIDLRDRNISSVRLKRHMQSAIAYS